MNNEIKQYLETMSSKLALNGMVSVAEAEKRSGDFNYAISKLIEWKHALSEQKIKLLSVQTAVYAEELSKGTAKTMTENKVTAEASGAYTAAREDLELIENDVSYLKAYMDLFNNGHIFYRNLAKESFGV